MADIRVGRKSGFPWWGYLLGVLGVVLLVLALRGCGTTPQTTGAVTGGGPERIERQEPGTTAGERVSDLAMFGSAANKQSMVGRAVAVQDVAVTRVLSDRVFTVSAGTTELFVMLADQLNQGAAEQVIRVRAGQMIDMAGTFHDVSDDQAKDEQSRGLNRKEFEQLQGQLVYLYATAIRDAD